MPSVSDEAICLRHWDFSETSQTVSLFTRELGMMRGLAKGARRERGNFSGGIDLLTRGNVALIIKPGRDLVTITEWNLIEAHWSLRQHLAPHRAALFMADLAQRMVHDHDPHPDLYDALAMSLAAMHNPEDVFTRLLPFLWALLTETGYQPQVNTLADTAGHAIAPDVETLAFDPRAGGVVEDTGQPGRWRVRRETVALLQQIAAGKCDAGQHDLAISERAARLLCAYIREILGMEPPTLKLLFHDL
ncbi:MAG: DNA repair protein RecO [Phycisphaerales bacterium]